MRAKIKVDDFWKAMSGAGVLAGSIPKTIELDAEPVEEKVPEWENKVVQLWCLPEHSCKAFDVVFAESIKKLMHEEFKKMGDEILKEVRDSKVGSFEGCIKEVLKRRGVS